MPRKITSKQQYLYSAAQKDLNGGYSIMMLRDSERELLAEVWKFAGFRFTAIIAGMPHRWDLIYKSLCDYSTQPAPKRGKAMKSLGLPEPVAAELKKNRISLRQWCNAYRCTEDETIKHMQKLARNELDCADKTGLIQRDFPYLSQSMTEKITLPPANFCTVI